MITRKDTPFSDATRTVNKSNGLGSNRTLMLTGKNSAIAEEFVTFVKSTYALLSSPAVFLSALTILNLDNDRWRVQLLFVGPNNTCEFAPFTTRLEPHQEPDWNALSAYLLLAILNERLSLNVGDYRTLQIVSYSLTRVWPRNLAGQKHGLIRF